MTSKQFFTEAIISTMDNWSGRYEGGDLQDICEDIAPALFAAILDIAGDEYDEADVAVALSQAIAEAA